tara:strand:- start:10948 stop:11718 length:771 start_codon:yes stop_codon:yes gene_type:complete
MRRIWVLMMFLAFPVNAQVEPREFSLNVGAEMKAAGLMQYLLPRFALKTGRRARIVDAGGDALLEKDGTGRPAMARGDSVWTLRLGSENPAAARFADWLLSDIGQNSLGRFTPETGAPFTPASIKIAVQEFVFEGDVDIGKRAALLNCGRCHRVAPDGTGIGIGSTPSFMALRALSDWAERFRNFPDRNPHPSFMQIEDISPAFDPAFPPSIIPVVISLQEMQAIQAYVSGLAPADLGADLGTYPGADPGALSGVE